MIPKYVNDLIKKSHSETDPVENPVFFFNFNRLLPSLMEKIDVERKPKLNISFTSKDGARVGIDESVKSSF